MNYGIKNKLLDSGFLANTDSKDLKVPKFDNIIESICVILRSLNGYEKGMGEIYYSMLIKLLDKYNVDYSQEIRKHTTPELHFIALTQSVITLLYADDRLRKQVIPTTYVTASDIAMYAFCPAAYAISKTYILPQNRKQKIGTDFHESSRLIRDLYKNQVFFNGKAIDVFKIENKSFLDMITSSTLVYSGHIDFYKDIFFSKADIVGQPDYIFRNKEGEYFVVEEKFREKSDSSNFFRNHKLQLASYMYNNNTYDIKFGYLIYWNYEIQKTKNAKTPIVNSCQIKLITKNEILEKELNKTIVHVNKINETLIANNSVYFDVSEINLSKCLGCSVAGFCSHKNGLSESLKIPYENYILNDIRNFVLPPSINGVNIYRFKTAIENFLGDKYYCSKCGKWQIASEILYRYYRMIDDNGVYKLIFFENCQYIKYPHAVTMYNYFSSINPTDTSVIYYEEICKNCTNNI